MTPARPDLVALDDERLASLANRGLVARAAKEIARGRGPTVSVRSDGTVVATAGEVVTRLEAGRALAETSCSCASRRLCRHRVAAVMAYRDGVRPGAQAARPPRRDSPGAIADETLAERLGSRALGRARRAAGRGCVAEVRRGGDGGEPPTVDLPTCAVRFLVPDELAHARCGCDATGPCHHLALAVWAFRRADRQAPGAGRVTVRIGSASRAPLAALDDGLGLSSQLLREGCVGSAAALRARFARAERPLLEARMRWPLDVCAELRAQLEAYARRGASHHPERVGELLTELHARARAARGGELPAEAILGTAEPTETPSDRVRLVSLGLRLRRERLGTERDRVRASVFLADPDTSEVLFVRTAWTESDAGRLDPEAAHERALLRAVHPGITLRSLARGQLVAAAARRRPSRELVLGATRRGALRATGVTEQTGRWDRLRPPLWVDDYRALARSLAARPPRWVRPRVLTDDVFVAAIHRVIDVTHHHGQQTLRAMVEDASGGRMELALEHSSGAPRALDALAIALGDRPRCVAGQVRLEGGRLLMAPLSVVTDRLVALEVETSGRGAQLPSVAGAASDGRLDRSLDPSPSPSVDRPLDPIVEALLAAREQLDRGAHQGLDHVTEAWRRELSDAADDLARVGLRRSARRLAVLGRRIDERPDAEVAGAPVVEAWVDASLRVRLCLEACGPGRCGAATSSSDRAGRDQPVRS